jgi:prolipoprotein diacylglyceryltransferase
MLYCIVAGLVALWMYRRTSAKQRPGLIFGVWLLIVFVTRFMLEFIKFDQEAFEANFVLNMGQVLSIPLIIWAVWLIWHALSHDPVPIDYAKR